MSSANNSTAVQRWSGWRRLVQQGGTVLMVLALVAGYLLFFNFSGSVQAASFETAWEAGKLISVGSSSNHSLAIKFDGTVVAWGDNRYSQCNLPDGLTGVVDTAAGGFHTLALKSDGTVVAKGIFFLDQCTVPEGLNGVVDVAAGFSHSLALKDDGTVVAWGNNDSGKCDIPPDLTNVVSIAAGGEHSLALKGDGTVVAWGSNSFGQCDSPAGLSNAVAVAAGYSHSLALKSDGTVAAWGSNSDGQCNVPEGLTDVVAIAAAQYYSVALKSDGTVVAWGNNLNYQCDVPAGLNNVVAIAATESYSVALKSDGTAVSWSSTNVARHVQNAVAAAGGYGHFLVLKNDGTIDSFLSSYDVLAGLNLAGGLSSIQTNGGVISSGFDPEAGIYSVTVPNGAEELQIIAHLEDSEAQVLLIEEQMHPDGAPFLVSPLTVGPNHVNLAVVSSATRLIRNHTVTITRADPDPDSADLWSLTTSTGSLDPVFDPAVTEYTASVDHRTCSIEICAIPFDAAATVTIGEGSPGDGAQTVNVALSPGENEILVLVRSANGLYEKQYTVTVHRASAPPAPPSPPEAEEGKVINLAGKDRLLTAIAISKWLYPDNDTPDAVVLARADNYPDALAGVPLAYALNAPLLLTYSDVLDPAVILEVERILDDSGTVYVLGGETAVSPAIIGNLDDRYTVVRLHGNDRYQTAVKIAKALTPAPATVFLTSGQDFPDAVTISSIAARLGAPILLTEADVLPTAVVDYLLANSGTIEKIYVIGGTGVISDTVYTQAGGTERIFGATRWATSAEIARRFFSSPSVITVSSGLGFPDALTGGVLAAKYNAPVLLSHSFLPSVTEAYIRQESNSINRVFTFGGPTVVSPSIADKIKEILK